MIKGNNPGNIRKNPTSKWQGEIPAPGEFVTFDTLINGYRAQIKLLSNYVRAGHDTINRIILRWAPPSDNNPTDDYAKFVSLKTGIDQNEKIQPNDYDTFTKLALAMSFFEHGIRDNDGTLAEAVNRAKELLTSMTAQTKESPLITAAILATLYFIAIKK